MFVSIAVLLAVSMLLVPHGVSATGVGPAKPSDLVTLIPQGFCPSGGFDMKIRVLPDASEVPFAIPAGRVFVITGWQWGEIVTLMTNAWEVERLRLETPTTSVTVGVAGNSTPGVPGTTPFNQTTSNNASIVGMIVVKPGVQVCVSTESRGLG
jgi:hypothetical protein